MSSAGDWYTARQAAEPVYGYKTLVDGDTDAILGAHLVGPHVEEVINLFALAIRHGLTARPGSWIPVSSVPDGDRPMWSTCSDDWRRVRPPGRSRPSSSRPPA